MHNDLDDSLLDVLLSTTPPSWQRRLRDDWAVLVAQGAMTTDDVLALMARRDTPAAAGAHVLTRLFDARAIGPLVAMLLDPEPTARTCRDVAAYALSVYLSNGVGAAQVIETLWSANSEDEIRLLCECLRSYAGQEKAQALLTCWRDKTLAPGCVVSVGTALGEMVRTAEFAGIDRDVDTELMASLHDDNSVIRATAADALRRRLCRRALPRLQEMAQHDDGYSELHGPVATVAATAATEIDAYTGPDAAANWSLYVWEVPANPADEADSGSGSCSGHAG